MTWLSFSPFKRLLACAPSNGHGESVVTLPDVQNGDVCSGGLRRRGGETDYAVFRPSTGTWHILKSGSGSSRWTVVALGDGSASPCRATTRRRHHGCGGVRPSTGAWQILSSAKLPLNLKHALGHGVDVAVPADYDGDGKADPSIYRPENGNWQILKSTVGYQEIIVATGVPNGIPVPGDYDGDGIADVAVFRPSDGSWFVRTSSTGFRTSFSVKWGVGTDTPIPMRP